MRKVEFDMCQLRADFVESYRWPRMPRQEEFMAVDNHVTVERVPIHSVSIEVVDGITLDFRIAISEPVYVDPESPIRVMLADIGLQARDMERRHRDSLIGQVLAAKEETRRTADYLRYVRESHKHEERERVAREEAAAYRASWAERYFQ